MKKMNQLKENRKQDAKDKIVKVKSQAKTVDQMVWDNNTGNPIKDSFVEKAGEVAGYITIEGYEFEVRMPLRKYMKRFEALSNRYNAETGEMDLSKSEALELNNLQSKIVEDMIPEFDDETDDFRVDQTMFNDIASFCWEFYRFFGRKSVKASTEPSG